MADRPDTDLLARAARLMLRGLGEQLRHRGWNAALVALALLFLLTAWVAGIAALAVWLAARFGMAGALGLIAGGALAAVLLIAAAIRLRDRRLRRLERDMAELRQTAMMSALAALPGFRAGPLLAMAALAGALFGLFRSRPGDKDGA